MDLSDIVRACLRRWYVVLPLLLITAWFAYHSYKSVKPEYYSNAVVGIAPPNVQEQYRPDGSPAPRNGLLETGGPALLVNMAVLQYDEPAVRAQVVAGGGRSNFAVRMFPSPAGSASLEQLPLMMIEATEADPNSAEKTVQLATAQADSVLRNLQQQAGVPDYLMAKALATSSPSPAVAGVQGRTKLVSLIMLAGIAVAVLAAVGLDILINGWQKRRERGRLSDIKAPDAPEDSAGQLQSNAHVHGTDSPSQDGIVRTSSSSSTGS